jgi:hypothetical protein
MYLDLINVTWDMLPDILKGALACVDGIRNDSKE